MNSEQRIEQVYKQFSKKLRDFILRRVTDKEETEDLLHDVFLKVHKNIDALKDSEKLESWLYQIARNAIIDFYRKKKDTRLDENFDIAGEHNDDDVPKRLSASVRSMVDRLEEPYRESLIAVEYKEMSQVEYAKKAGLSISGAKSRVQRARTMLKDLLMQCCHFEFDRYGTIIDYYPHTCSCCAEEVRRK
jgi:RNA polymerase sigma-70 factor (ECF subfamily)